MDTDIRAMLSAIPRGEKAAQLPHQELVQILDSVVSSFLQLLREVETLREDNRVQEEQIKTLEERNNALLRRLNTNSGNSGIPPSKDPPWYTGKQDNADTQTGDGDSSPATTNEKEPGDPKDDSKDDSKDSKEYPLTGVRS